MYTHNYTDEHVVSIKTKQGKIVGFNFHAKKRVKATSYDGAVVENLQIKDLTDEQVYQIWRRNPSYKWEFLQSYTNLSKEKTDLYKEYYKNDKIVRCAIDEGIVTFKSSDDYSFLDEVDELIKEQEENQF